MKRVYIATLLTCAVLLALFASIFIQMKGTPYGGTLKVGFIYEDDESVPYTANFAEAERALMEEYKDRIEIYSKNNVPDTEAEEPLMDLIQKGCNIIFTNSYTEEFMKIAGDYPHIQFCQASFLEALPENAPENYHTFKGTIYEGRYLSGIAAGMKLRELIDREYIESYEAKVGYVAAFPNTEVISGFTAFILGIRTVVPEAKLKVRYTYSWGNFKAEKRCAEELISEGCVVLSQHTDTIGPAVACEEAVGSLKRIFVGYNQSMQDVAPTSVLISTRINWTPYVLGAVEAVRQNRKIETVVKGNVHGNDISAGMKEGWVKLLDLNDYNAAQGTAEALAEAEEKLKDGSLQVFQGDYIGVNPNDPQDTIDLNNGFEENAEYSSPSFHYILEDIITVEEDEG